MTKTKQKTKTRTKKCDQTGGEKNKTWTWKEAKVN